MQFGSVIIVGAGGTGSNLAINLFRNLENCYNTGFIIDGDSFEDKNLTRQLFPASFVGNNKAEVISKQVFEYTNQRVKCVKKYLFGEDIKHFLDKDEINLIIDCVDNNQSRNRTLKGLYDSSFDYVYCTPGNAELSGNICAEFKIGDRRSAKLIEEYKEYQVDSTRLPIEKNYDCYRQAMGYAEEKEVAQTLLANVTAANMVLWWLFYLQSQNLLYTFGKFDLTRNEFYLEDETAITIKL